MKNLEELIVKILMIAASLSVLCLLLFILFVIVSKGLPSMNWQMISKVPSGGFYLGKEGGILNAILGSLLLIAGAVLISIILSLPVVLFINFILKGNSAFSQIVRLAYDILFGIPSIVYGAFGLMLMIFFGIQASLLGGTIAISLLIMPIMVRSIDEVAGSVPIDLIEATKAMGATRFETVKIIVRQLTPGISTAILLSIGRGIGDAATVLLTAGYTDSITVSPFDPVATLPLAIFFQLSSPIPEVQNRAYSAAFVLTSIILFLSLVTRWAGRCISKSKL